MSNRSNDSGALVCGVDGCRAGWVYITAETIDRRLVPTGIAIADSFAHLTEATSDAVAVCVDVPIGLSPDGRRDADAMARALLGPRRSSVFPPPARALLTASDDYAALNVLSKSIRAGLSRQTYGILPKMREADATMTPALQRRVRECHPEVSFRTLKGEPLAHNKKTPEGRAERQDLLSRVFGGVYDWRAPRGAAMDDLLDAAVLAWTASRIVSGEVRTLPPDPPRDERGLRMEIVY